MRIDLPVGIHPYDNAARLLAAWRDEGVIVRDERAGDVADRAGVHRARRPDRARARVSSRACAWRSTARAGSGPTSAPTPARRRTGSRLTRATKANLSPIFSLFDDPAGAATGALANATTRPPWGEATDDDGTVNRLWRIEDPHTIATIHEASPDAELLIADGHHRYETARVYAEEIGGEGPHRYVLMCLVALEDPG